MLATVLVALCLAADPLAPLRAGKPTLPAPLDRLTPGMKEPALLAALKVSADDECFVLGTRVGGLCFVPFWAEDDGYERPALLFPSLAATRAGLRKRWGEPEVYGGFWYWVNPKAKPPLRAQLRGTSDPAQLDLETYLPLETFLGAGPKLPFEREPIIGSSRSAIEKAHRITCESETCGIFFPPPEVGGNLLVLVDLEGGDVARSFTFDLPTRDDEARKERTMKLLEAKWGKRQPVPGEPKDFTFEKRSDVLVYQLGGTLTVRVRP